MAPRSSSKNSRRLRALRHYSGFNNGKKVKPSKRRVQHDIIEGINIYSFQNELELEYFSCIEEPLPRKIKRFRGFDETDNSVNMIKNHFDEYIRNFINDPHSSKAVQPNEDCLIRAGESQVPADEQASTVLAIDYENSLSLKTTDGSPDIDTTGPNNDTSVHIVNEPVVVITISDSDSDDDVIMISDPKAPLPQPVRECVCPNCGKMKPRESCGNERLTSESYSDAELDDVSISVQLVQPEDVPNQLEDRPMSTQLQGATVHPEDVPMPIRPEGGTVQPDDASMLTPPEGSTVHPEDVPMTTQPERLNIRPDDLPMPAQPEGSAVHPEGVPMPNQSTGVPVKPEYVFQPDYVPSQPADIPFQPEELSASRIRKPIVTTSGGDSSHQLHGLNNLTDQPGSPLPPQVSPKGQKPSNSKNKTPAIASGTIRLTLPDAGKTVILKLDGAKSKVLPSLPPQTKPLAHNYHVTIPPNKIHQITVPVGSPDENKVTRTRPLNEAMDRVQVGNACDTKPGVVAPDNRLQEGLAKQLQVEQQTVENADVSGDISVVERLKGSPSNWGKVASASSSKVHDSAMVALPTSDVVSVSVEMPAITKPSSSKPLVIEHATRSVVQDLVDFVCRKERFPTSYPYDQKRMEIPCLAVPCRELRCRMGCVCVSLAKKNMRRVRCKNASCIFGCICTSYGVAVLANRQAKSRPNVKKVLGIFRGKEVLNVLPESDKEGSGFSSSSQPASSRFLLPMKVLGSTRASSVAGYSGSEESTPGHHLLRYSESIRVGSGCGSTPRPAPKVLKLPSNGLCVQKPVGNSASQASCQDPVKGLSVSVTHPRRFFGRKKIPIPERALVCLTPGLGYVPLEQTSTEVTIPNPFIPGTTKSFLHIKVATEWLNSNLQAILNTTTNLRWVVADKSTIEKKQLHRLSIHFKKP